MSGAALIGVEHQLDRYNQALAPFMRGENLTAYATSFFVVYVGLCFVPTAIALARHYYGLRRIVAWNAAPPIAVLLASLLFYNLPDAGRLGDALTLLIVAGGFVAWISTMIDAATGPSSKPEEA
jgi:hypothetical protein